MLGTHLNISIPCYGKQIFEPCFLSMINFTNMAQVKGLSWTLNTIGGESFISRARNNLCASMMGNAKATHFMFVDADIEFKAEDIFKLLDADKDVVGGLYPSKSIPPKYIVNKISSGEETRTLIEVATIGTGFMMFRREVYEKLIKAHPETKYVDDVGFGKTFEKYMYAIFDGGFQQCRDGMHYLSEDWTFCNRWRALGGKIFAHKQILLNHHGTYAYKSDQDMLDAALKDKSTNIDNVDCNVPAPNA